MAIAAIVNEGFTAGFAGIVEPSQQVLIN